MSHTFWNMLNMIQNRHPLNAIPPSSPKIPQDPSLLGAQDETLEVESRLSTASDVLLQKVWSGESKLNIFCCFRNSSPAHCWAPRVRRFFGKRQVDGWFLTWIVYVNHVYIHSMKWMNRSQKQQVYLFKIQGPNISSNWDSVFLFFVRPNFFVLKTERRTKKHTQQNRIWRKLLRQHRVTHAKLPYLDRISDRQRLGFTTSWFFLLWKNRTPHELFLVEMRKFGKNGSKRDSSNKIWRQKRS